MRLHEVAVPSAPDHRGPSAYAAFQEIANDLGVGLSESLSGWGAPASPSPGPAPVNEVRELRRRVAELRFELAVVRTAMAYAPAKKR